MGNNKKRRCYITVILLAVLTVVSGCDKVNDSNSSDANARASANDTNASSAIGTSASNGASDDDLTSVENSIANTDNDATEADSEETTADQYKIYKEYISPKKKDEIQLDSESESLYEGFLYGDIEAEYVSDGDISRALCLAEVLTDGESYTLTEIEEKLCDGCEYATDWIYENNIVEEYIDLGLDGTYELKTDIGAAAFNLTLVVKNIDGHLKICLAGDSWEKSYTEVLYSGEVSIYTVESYLKHRRETGFVDANGEYHFWYIYTGEAFNLYQKEDLYYNDRYIGSEMGLYVEAISFEKDLSDSYYYINIVDVDNNDIEENTNDPEDPYKLCREALEAEGKNVLTIEEIEKLQDEKHQEIGFDDKLYYYGEELKPDEE